MKTHFKIRLKRALWRCLHWLHHYDYAVFLSQIARWPLPLAYAASSLRGRINAALGRDWRSMALGSRHIWRLSQQGYALLPGAADALQQQRWCRERFRVEARDELEARLVAARRLHELQCRFEPADAPLLCRNRTRGLVLLTPHFDSFYLGIALLAQASGQPVHSMASAVTQDPRVDEAVRRHFHVKYRGLESYLNGGLVPEIEGGLRPFYRMLESHETLVILADAPVLPQGAAMTVDFLGGPRVLAGGALRLAQRTGSDLGCFVCICTGPGRYALRMGPVGAADDPQTLQHVYDFLGAQIMASPGRWWAADLLPNLPLEKARDTRTD